MKERKTNIAASVRQRLFNLSRAGEGQAFQRILVRYAIERLLYRLSRSPQCSAYVLKGASLFAIWADAPFRATGDVDLLGSGATDADATRKTFADLCKLKVADDGLVFDAVSIRVETLREEEEYQGLRVRLDAKLGTAVIPVQVDIGFGDAVHPEPQELTYPLLLEDMPPARVRAYGPETVVAEKLEAMVRFGEITSRVKDHYDLWAISRTFPFDMDVLGLAVASTFKRRGTDIPRLMPAPLTQDFAADRTKLALWEAFLKRMSPTLAPPPFTKVVGEIRAFIKPVLLSLRDQKIQPNHWIPGAGWNR